MPEQQIIDVTCPMLEDDFWLSNRLAERLGVSVPQAISLAVRLLAECEAQGVIHKDPDGNFIIARLRRDSSRDPGGHVSVYF